MQSLRALAEIALACEGAVLALIARFAVVLLSLAIHCCSALLEKKVKMTLLYLSGMRKHFRDIAQLRHRAWNGTNASRWDQKSTAPHPYREMAHRYLSDSNIDRS